MVGYHQTNQKTDTGKTLTRWPVLVDHNSVGLATGLIGMAADAMVEDVNYTMVTDLQISERSKVAVTTDNIAALKQGTSGVKLQTSTEQGNRAKYQTRVVSNANKVNLKFEEAKPVLEAQLAKSIAGIM